MFHKFCFLFFCFLGGSVFNVPFNAILFVSTTAPLMNHHWKLFRVQIKMQKKRNGLFSELIWISTLLFHEYILFVYNKSLAHILQLLYVWF